MCCVCTSKLGMGLLLVVSLICSEANVEVPVILTNVILGAIITCYFINARGCTEYKFVLWYTFCVWFLILVVLFLLRVTLWLKQGECCFLLLQFW